jgi:hypothetical protein
VVGGETEGGWRSHRETGAAEEGGYNKADCSEMRDLDLTISPMELERETTHEDGGPAGPTMKEALLASVTKGRPQQGDGAQCSGVEVSTIGWSEPPRSRKPEGVYAHHTGKVASPSRVDKDDQEGSAREHRLDVMRREEPELFQMFFQGAVKGIGGADGKDRVLKINRFAQKEGSLTEVRWDAELCPGCELERLPPGSELFRKVCARCYASARSGKVVQMQAQPVRGEEVARGPREEKDRAGGARTTPDRRGPGSSSQSPKWVSPLAEAVIRDRLARAAERASTRAGAQNPASVSNISEERRKSVTARGREERKEGMRHSREETDESELSSISTSDSDKASSFARERRSMERRTYGEECAYAMRHPRVRDEWQRSLRKKFRSWLKRNTEGLSAEKKAFVSSIDPKIIYLSGKTLASAALCKAPKIGYKQGSRSVLDARENFRALDNYMGTAACPPYRLMLQIWDGEVYEGQEMKIIVQGDIPSTERW